MEMKLKPHRKQVTIACQKETVEYADLLTTLQDNTEPDILDLEIDWMQYELYGLNEEEIEIVEGSVG